MEAVGASKTEATALSGRLREELLESGRFIMVNHTRWNTPLEEQALQQAGRTGGNCVVKVGRIPGVRKIVLGRAVVEALKEFKADYLARN